MIENKVNNKYKKIDITTDTVTEFKCILFI